MKEGEGERGKEGGRVREGGREGEKGERRRKRGWVILNSMNILCYYMEEINKYRCTNSYTRYQVNTFPSTHE